MSRDSLFFLKGAGYNECRLETTDLIPPDSHPKRRLLGCGDKSLDHRMQPLSGDSTDLRLEQCRKEEWVMV